MCSYLCSLVCGSVKILFFLVSIQYTAEKCYYSLLKLVFSSISLLQMAVNPGSVWSASNSHANSLKKRLGKRRKFVMFPMFLLSLGISPSKVPSCFLKKGHHLQRGNTLAAKRLRPMTSDTFIRWLTLQSIF